MDSYRHIDLDIGSAPAAAVLPPPTIDETAWDILLALYADRRRQLSIEKLGSVVSVPRIGIASWLAALEDRRLISGAKDEPTGELRAVLTANGRELLDRYLSAVNDLESSSGN